MVKPESSTGNGRTRYDAYIECCRRGHEPNGTHWSRDGGKTWKEECKWCGTTYWHETVLHEENAPETRDE